MRTDDDRWLDEIGERMYAKARRIARKRFDPSQDSDDYFQDFALATVVALKLLPDHPASFKYCGKIGLQSKVGIVPANDCEEPCPLFEIPRIKAFLRRLSLTSPALGKLVELRLKGLTQRECGECLGLSPSQVSVLYSAHFSFLWDLVSSLGE